MSYIAHHAIVVTGGRFDDAPSIDQARQAAIDAGCTQVTPIVGPAVNATYSFLVAPDGSKEGWDESEAGDSARDAFIAWLSGASGWFDWAEVRYSPDDADAGVSRHAWVRRR